MDLSSLIGTYSGRGSAAIPPDIMLRLALYETSRGVGSPNRWAVDAKESKPLNWLLRGIQPSPRACYRFRDRLGSTIDALHEEIINHAMQDQLLVDPKEVAQDGSSHRACASRHRVVNKEQLNKRRCQLEEQIESGGGSDPAPYWMPNTPSGQDDLLERMTKAAEVLDERLEKNAQRNKSDRLDEKHVCVSLSDPEAAISRDKEKVFGPMYTAQYLVDYETSLVLGFSVAAAATDVGTLIPMVDKTQALVGGTIERVCTDSTYATVLELKECRDRNIDLIALVQENSYTEKNRQRRGTLPSSNKQDFEWLEDDQTYQCPAGYKLTFQYTEHAKRAGGRRLKLRRFHCPPENCLGCKLTHGCVKDPSRGRTIKRLDGQELVDAQRERMKQPDAQQLHRLRGSVVERAIADAKQHRNARSLHGRGLSRATTEIGLTIMVQNILTLQRLRKTRENAVKQPPKSGKVSLSRG